MTPIQLNRFDIKIFELGFYSSFSIDVKVATTVRLEWVGGFGMTPAR